MPHKHATCWACYCMPNGPHTTHLTQNSKLGFMHQVWILQAAFLPAAPISVCRVTKEQKYTFLRKTFVFFSYVLLFAFRQQMFSNEFQFLSVLSEKRIFKQSQTLLLWTRKHRQRGLQAKFWQILTDCSMHAHTHTCTYACTWMTQSFIFKLITWSSLYVGVKVDQKNHGKKAGAYLH